MVDGDQGPFSFGNNTELKEFTASGVSGRGRIGLPARRRESCGESTTDQLQLELGTKVK
jgi:hypothetical protein